MERLIHTPINIDCGDFNMRNYLNRHSPKNWRYRHRMAVLFSGLPSGALCGAPVPFQRNNHSSGTAMRKTPIYLRSDYIITKLKQQVLFFGFAEKYPWITKKASPFRMADCHIYHIFWLSLAKARSSALSIVRYFGKLLLNLKEFRTEYLFQSKIKEPK